jgi:hypothetical protein
MARTGIVAAALTCLFLAQERDALAEPISEVDDSDLAFLLTFMEVLAERGGKGEPEPLFIRLVRLQGPGECDATPLSCPMERIYIAVSNGDYPERKVYQLPGAPGWDFKEWISTPDGEDADDFYTFIVEKKVVAADISKGWWATERYEVSVNMHIGELERLP